MKEEIVLVVEQIDDLIRSEMNDSLHNYVGLRNRVETLLQQQHKKDIEKIGITIMDGDFCSILPKGFDKNTFLLYHVKNSVIREVKDVEIPKQWSVGKTLIKNDFIFILNSLWIRDYLKN